MEEQLVMDNAEKNLEFFNKSFKGLEKEYPNRFIAISGAKIVAIADTPDAIFQEIEEKKIDQSNLLVEFIPIAGSILVL